MRWLKWVILVVVVLAAGGYFYMQGRLNQSVGPSEAETVALRAEVAAQNEGAFYQPDPRPAEYPAPSATKNVYFGELHVHTDLSFDSYIFGNRLGLDEAYEVAKGKCITAWSPSALKRDHRCHQQACTML